VGQQTSEASAKAGPGVHCGGPGSYSGNGAKKQRRSIPPLPDVETGITVAQWRQSLVDQGLFRAVELVSLDELGPVGLIGGVRVCIGFCDAQTYVWLERRPWGSQWANANLFFIDRDHVQSGVGYALKLARSIRKVALAEQGHQERRKEARRREKYGDWR
jgi:hypothetical protein